MDREEEVKLRSAGGRARMILLDLLREMDAKRLIVHDQLAGVDRTDETKDQIAEAVKELESFTLPT
jgi:hypothetical protein